ncbi:hypothetical protein Tco_0337828 [Tanacetum coccineum]
MTHELPEACEEHRTTELYVESLGFFNGEREWQRIRDEDRLMSHIQHEHDKFKELVRTVETGPQDGPADVGSSYPNFLLALSLKCFDVVRNSLSRPLANDAAYGHDWEIH